MAQDRPLSPHLQVYRPQLTSMMSIAHRATGVALTTGTIVLAAWIISWRLGLMLALTASLWRIRWGNLSYSATALIYHALNGVRHIS